MCDKDVVAVLRIPGKQGAPRPILLKLISVEKMAHVMQNRDKVKNSEGKVRWGDVARENSELNDRLNAHLCITSAWYFNGNCLFVCF